MQRSILWWAEAFVAALLGCQLAQASADVAPVAASSSPAALPNAAQDLAQQVLASFDHRGLPFAIVDKRSALVMVYRGDGTLAGLSTVLLGQTTGDHSAGGVGERTRNGRLRLTDRITPAGRFESEPGRNLTGEPILWVDYDSALAIHRLRPGPSRERRAQRMGSMKTSEKRISAGCIVVPELFYQSVIHPVLGSGFGVVYVMPEHSSWQEWWRDLAKHGL